MAIKQKTFKPSAEHGALTTAMIDANTWLAETPVKVINIETLTRIHGGHMEEVKSKEVGIRVWYEQAD